MGRSRLRLLNLHGFAKYLARHKAQFQNGLVVLGADDKEKYRVTEDTLREVYEKVVNEALVTRGYQLFGIDSVDKEEDEDEEEENGDEETP